MSLAGDLSLATLDRLVSALGAIEVGSPYRTLKSPMSPTPVGSVRVFSGGRIQKIVYIGLGVPPIGLDSHMIFAFTKPESLIPHFTLDAVLAGPSFAFHLDFIPKADLGANLAYLHEIYQPLSDEFAKVRKIEGLEVAHLTPRQYAIMSPWMLAYRATAEAFAKIESSVRFYEDHWMKILGSGVAAALDLPAAPSAIAARDRLNKAAIFNAEIDPVWANVARLVGEAAAAEMREILKDPNVPA